MIGVRLRKEVCRWLCSPPLAQYAHYKTQRHPTPTLPRLNPPYPTLSHRPPDNMEFSTNFGSSFASSSFEPVALSATRPRPIPNSYWATPLVLACEFPWSPYASCTNKCKLDALLAAGVRAFIDLTESGELKPYSDILCQRAEMLGIDPGSIDYYRFPIRDRCTPESGPGFMSKVFKVLEQNRDRGRITAVHCRGGIGRTGMVIGCWLVQSGIAKDGEEALSIIAREWRTVEKCRRYPNSPETGAQFEFVKTFRGNPGRSGLRKALKDQ
ncbi:hypothetical protein CYLTODRAFT_417215 [Cylindrobasidium torrendii FP15055 ss-10]|uniref:Tyrosine specific protein phosphatases domain-containing protein n=1 Tax=Cylindrobasidium torrendii FP15055 ss-10 TaxID=1314674 RepID=A0A0D7BSN2_9AGAR|nr:hypothetical protein CYLTODRAFT_417215 [Cylindrobasidium torrendii FP15055 ss-10]